MANNVFIVNSLGSANSAVTVTDDGTGIDWLTITGSFQTYTSITLEFTYAQNGTATSAWGRFDTFGPPTTTTLRINGIIENVRGSDTADFIGGNHASNLIYGDAASTGMGGSDTINGDDGDDTIFGGSGADSLLGAGDDDVLFGNDGADTISGNSGVDIIDGGSGADSLSGGGQSRDKVTYADSNAGVTVQINFGTTTTGIGGHAQGDRINGFTDVTGSDFGDVITDAVAGTIAFGYNANRFFGGAGNDTLTLGGGADFSNGGDGRDGLFGGEDNDTLWGANGRDRLLGGEGADRLVGGNGADSFVFLARVHSTTTPDGRDSISDFSRADGDKIDLRRMDAHIGGADNAFSFIGTNAFSDTAGELRLRDTGSGFVVLGDVDGDGTADFAIVVQNIAAMNRFDFLL